MSDKFFGRLAGLLLLGVVAAAAEPVKPADACCAAPAGASSSANAAVDRPFGRNSLYQAAAGFTADNGRAFALGELRGRPVVLAMFFASCGYACPLIVADMQRIQARLPAEIRDRAAFVLVSFDVGRDTPAALAHYRTERNLDGQWVLLHGSDDSVRELAALLGVKYKQDADGAFAHSNLISILNGEGEIIHQRPGLQGGLDQAAAALVAAVRK